MGYLNLIIGLVAALLVVTGINKEEKHAPVLTKEKNLIEENNNSNKAKPIEQTSFSFETLKKKAEQLLSTPYEEPAKSTNKSLAELDYYNYKEIRFLPEKSLWKKEGMPFQIQFMHPGHLYNHNITIYELKGKRESKISYNREMFDLSSLNLKEKLPDSISFSGFKVHYPINTDEHTDEFCVYQGASYFRSVSEKQVYGLSARGLAVNTAMPYPEDFPIFKEFWIEKPAKKSRTIKIYALLDGKSAVGAFEFEYTPGKITTTHVKATITLRKQIDRLGIAPLTSMFWYGENSEQLHTGSYPEIHDSDGLLIKGDSDEWIWRPLVNPNKPTINSFKTTHLKGFGLIQRDREFSSYEDDKIKYHLRPSAWIEPINGWDNGSVQLYRMPTDKDSLDNIVAFWVPDTMPEVGKPFDIEYNIHWIADKPEKKKNADTIATRVKTNPGELNIKVFQLDFKGETLDSADPNEIEHFISSSDNGEISDAKVSRIEETNKWRLSFKIKNKSKNNPIEVKAYLKDKRSILTESWTYTVEF